MRYILVDRITALVPGHSLDAIKNVTHAEDLVTRDRAGRSALPAAMVLEAMAQAAGLLVAASSTVAAQPVLAKVQPFAAYDEARPGDAIAIRVELEELRAAGCRARVSAAIASRPLADATIFLALVPLDGAGLAARSVSMRALLAETFPGWFQ
jgi:3-hydroxymyristoyl/3-hydroxydecanoyl-(acyl carrier protein) dehydratase